MSFIKHTRAEKVDVLKPAENAKVNLKTSAKVKVSLDDLALVPVDLTKLATKCAQPNCSYPDCGC